MSVLYFSFTFASDSEEVSIELLQKEKGSLVMHFSVNCFGPQGGESNATCWAADDLIVERLLSSASFGSYAQPLAYQVPTHKHCQRSGNSTLPFVCVVGCLQCWLQNKQKPQRKY